MVLFRWVSIAVALTIMLVVAVREYGASTDDPVVWHYVADPMQPIWLIDLDTDTRFPYAPTLPPNILDIITFQGHVLAITTTGIYRFEYDQNQFLPVDFVLDDYERILLVAGGPTQLAVVTTARPASDTITTIYLTDLVSQQTALSTTRALRQLQWEPAGNWLVAVEYDGEQSYVYRLAIAASTDITSITLALIHTLPEAILTLDISPEGDYLAVGMAGRESAVLIVPSTPSDDVVASYVDGFYGVWWPDNDHLMMLMNNGFLKVYQRSDDQFSQNLGAPSVGNFSLASVARLWWRGEDELLFAGSSFRLNDAGLWRYRPAERDVAPIHIITDVTRSRSGGILTDFAVADVPLSSARAGAAVFVALWMGGFGLFAAWRR